MAGELSYNLADLFEAVADQVGQRIAIAVGGRHYHYAELEDRANRLANHWRQRGIGQGDHVGLQLYNGVEYLEAMLAAYKLRAVPININYHYIERELDYLYRDADLVAVVTQQAFLPRVTQVAADIEALRELYWVADDSHEVPGAECRAYEQVLANSSPGRDFPVRSADDLYIVYTGGTTGMPKGVMWHHRDIFFAALGGGDISQTGGPIKTPGEIIERIPEHPLTALPAPPFMHAAAQWTALSVLLAGGKVVIPAGGQFQPEAVWQAVHDEAVNMLVVVGDAMTTPLVEALRNNPGRWNTDSLGVVVSGGALFSPVTKQQLLEQLPRCMVLDGLGSSETGIMGNKTSTAANAADREPRFAVSTNMTVLDEHNRPLAPGSGETGRLARRGHVPIGYYKAPDKSAATFVEIDGQRWAIPGDFATVAADGSIVLLGRGSVSINSGGEKIYPEEVEAALKEHPAILDAVVIGLPEPRFGEQVVAVCQTVDGATLDLGDLRTFCRERLAAYKLPRELVCLAQIKRSPAGKADYPWARKVAADALARR